MGAWVTGIAPEGAVSAVDATQIRQGQKNFAGIGDDARLEAFFSGAGRRQKLGQIAVSAANQAQRGFPRDRSNGDEWSQRHSGPMIGSFNDPSPMIRIQ